VRDSIYHSVVSCGTREKPDRKPLFLVSNMGFSFNDAFLSLKSTHIMFTEIPNRDNGLRGANIILMCRMRQHQAEKLLKNSLSQ
jgi:hypothetical protein